MVFCDNAVLLPSNCLSNLRHFSSCHFTGSCEVQRALTEWCFMTPYLAHIYYYFEWLRQKSRACGAVTWESQSVFMHTILQNLPLVIKVRLDPSYQAVYSPPYRIQHIQNFSPVFSWVSWTEGQRCWCSHEGVVSWWPVGEAWECSGCFFDAAGHSWCVVAQRGGHRQVGELWVKVSEVCGTRLWKPSKTGRN